MVFSFKGDPYKHLDSAIPLGLRPEGLWSKKAIQNHYTYFNKRKQPYLPVNGFKV